MMNPQHPGDHPDWSRDVTAAIDGIFKMLLQVAESLAVLEARIAALEAATPAPQEEATT